MPVPCVEPEIEDVVSVRSTPLARFGSHAPSTQPSPGGISSPSFDVDVSSFGRISISTDEPAASSLMETGGVPALVMVDDDARGSGST